MADTSTLDFCGEKIALMPRAGKASAKKTRAQIKMAIAAMEENGPPLPCEQRAMEKIQGRLRAVDIKEKYQVIDLGFLGMTRPEDKDGAKFPRFALYSADGDDPDAVFMVRRPLPIGESEESKDFRCVFSDNTFLPECVQTHYRKLAGEIRKKLPQAIGFKSEMADVIIPGPTRGKIREAQALFAPNHIFLVAETQNWGKADQEIEEMARDPLVIGIFANEAYYIDKFDPTPLENYVSREFTV